MNETGLNSVASPALPSAAIAVLQQGDKIAAIKIVREERSLGLKEAKDAVEEYVRTKPNLQAALAAQSASGRSALNWVLALIALAMLAYYLLRKS